MRILYAGLLLALGLCLLPTPASAVNYGTFTGTTATFSNVSEDSTAPQLGSPLPGASGPSLIFNPSAFSRSASGAGSWQFVSDTVTVDIGSIGSYFADTVRVQTKGDYTLSGTGGAGTVAQASGTVFVNVLEVNGHSIVPLVIPGVAEQMSPTDGSFSLPGGGPGGTWSGDVTVDVDAALAAAGIQGRPTRVTLSVQETLYASSESGTSSFIRNDPNRGLVITVVPEPATLALMAVGGLVLLRVRRRHKA